MPVNLEEVKNRLYTTYFYNLSLKEQEVVPNTVHKDLEDAEKEFGESVMIDEVWCKISRWLTVYNWESGKAIGAWRKKFRGIVNKLRKEKA